MPNGVGFNLSFAVGYLVVPCVRGIVGVPRFFYVHTNDKFTNIIKI